LSNSISKLLTIILLIFCFLSPNLFQQKKACINCQNYCHEAEHNIFKGITKISNNRITQINSYQANVEFKLADSNNNDCNLCVFKKNLPFQENKITHKFTFRYENDESLNNLEFYKQIKISIIIQKYTFLLTKIDPNIQSTRLIC